jgi:GntR family transcriptional regulator
MGLMISFDSFVISDGSPIYMQILRYIQRGAAAGRIADGDELPSRRVLSALLGINPNTVQKAYRMLEEAGLMESHAGAKSYMCLDAEKITAIRTELLENDAKAAVDALRQLGITRAEALALIGRIWGEEHEE